MAQFLEGPDQIIPSESLITTEINGHVNLRIPESGKAIETIPPISVPGLLQKTVDDLGNAVALAYKSNKVWNKITYNEYLKLVKTCAKAFIKLGLERHHSVCILGFNSPEWFISDLAAIFAGGVAVGIYTTNSSEACFHCIDLSKAQIVVVQDQKQLDKILAIKSRLPYLKAIIQYEGTPSSPGVLSWQELMNLGKDVDDEILDSIIKTIAVNECCTLVFTSGTVGKPKAVMLSHDNLTWDAIAITQRINLKRGEEVLISYLPLSHVAAQVVDIYIAMLNGACVYFADSNALKGSLVTTMQEVQPTKFLAVPRVWEKMYEKMQQVGAQSGYLKKTIATWAKNQGLQYHLDKINGGNSESWGYTLASMLIFGKIRQALGLGRCDLFASAAAPLAADIKKYFLSIDIPIFEAFGMSEASGAHSLCTPTSYGLDTIGPCIPGMKTKIVNVDESDQGEICLYGRHVFMGYLKDAEKTAETIDADGWLHSGDIGHIDAKELIFITGRLKELLITAGGENVAPVPIEQLVKAQLPHVSNAILIGDRKKFLAILLTLKTEVDEDGRPLDTLVQPAQKWLAQLGCPATTVTEVLDAGPDAKLLQAIQEGVDNVNKIAVSNAQRIQKLAILPVDFSVPTGELGPTLKMKRNVVVQKYEHIIDKLYI